MASVGTGYLKKLIKEDFNKKDQDLVSKISFVLNPAIQQLINILNNGLDIESLNIQVKTISIVVDANGNPLNPTTFLSTLQGKCTTMWVGAALDTTTPTTYPTATPFISFTDPGTGSITINNIAGIAAGDTWSITFIASV